MTERIFIIGMYKSGTSWLLSALSEVPGIAGLREIDILDGVALRASAGYVLRDRAERLEYVFGGAAWCALPVDYQSDAALRHVLKGRPAAAADGRLRIGELDPVDAVLAVRKLLAHRRQSRGKHVDWAAAPELPPIPMGVKLGEPALGTFRNLSKEQAESLFRSVGDARSIEEAAEAFARINIQALTGIDRLVFKGADMVNRAELLASWAPDARKIVIVRDGRDVALSAYHYRKLMSEWRMPWHNRKAGDSEAPAVPRLRAWVRSMFQRKRELKKMLLAWSDRIDTVLQLEKSGDVLVLRYEDLSRNFLDEFRRVDAWLGLGLSEPQIRSIAECVSFEAQTGRKKGEVKDRSVRRSGKVAGWTSGLSVLEARMAWRLAGANLLRLGYDRDGKAVRQRGGA